MNDRISIKVGMRVHWENYVDWVEGIVTSVERKNRQDIYCDECGTLLEFQSYEQYKRVKVLVDKQKNERLSCIGQILEFEASKLRPVPYSGITI
jgi:hypothetical protein